MQQINNDNSIEQDIELIEEENDLTECELEKTITPKETASSMSRVPSTVEKKSLNSLLKSKRYCKFNKEWIKISKYASFLQECRTNSSFAHCSICKSNFSIANGGKYLIDRYLEKAAHKRLAAVEAKHKSPFMTAKITQMINKTGFYSLSFDASNKGHKKMFPFVINYFTVEGGIERSVIEVIELVNETADYIVASLREVLQMNNINIQNMTSIGADNTNVNYGRNHSVFSLLKSDVPNLMKGNCFSHVLNNAVKTSHTHLMIDVESILSKLYGHFSSSTKRVESLKEYFDFVEQDHLLLLKHISIRWLSLYPSIERLLKVLDPLSAYFLDLGDRDEFPCPPTISIFFTSTEAKCTMYFLHNVLFDLQKKSLELQRYYISIVDLRRIITSLLTKLNDRLKQNFFGYQTKVLLNSLANAQREKLNKSFVDYVSSIIKYIEKYYDEQSELAELTAVFGICDIDEIKFCQIEKCVAFLKLEVDHDKLFDEMNILQSTFKEVNSYRESLSHQIQKYIGDRTHGSNRDIINDQYNESEDERDLFHKSAIESHENENRIRSDQLWGYLLSKSTTFCSEMTKILAYVYSIPCSNAFAEGVFSHMKHSWTPSRNLMSTETIAAELKIRLNSKMKCEDFYSFAQSQPELIKCAHSKQKYSHIKKRVLTIANREGLFQVNIFIVI
ncbi:unnamed protein product [Rotaria magnacalcarata]|uniref:HAT C-terminal dimerisation domain-containing protein n=1 Tax=Rotaria magnacalcarata TaxID=392030 RepID=A0A815MPQ0_9BILA|nr:unnamed protein product [Rotaria magnacalcarata]